MNKVQQDKLLKKAHSDSKLYDIKEEVVKNKNKILDLQNDVTFCMEELHKFKISLENIPSNNKKLTKKVLLTSSESNISSLISEKNASNSDISQTDSFLIDDSASDAIIEQDQITNRLKKLEIDIYSDEYYKSLTPMCKEAYKFWMEKYQFQKFNPIDYLEWENFFTKQSLLKIQWSSDQIPKLISWIFIKYSNYILINNIFINISDDELLSYLTPDNIEVFKNWWAKIVDSSEMKFSNSKVITFNIDDFSLTETKIIWPIICVNDSIINQYFQFKKIKFIDEKIDSEFIIAIKKNWDNILWKNFNESIFNIFIHNNIYNNKEMQIEGFLDSIFKQLKIIINNENKNTFFANTLLELNNSEFTNSIFEKQTLESVWNDFISFADANISTFDNFILQNYDWIKIFNNWLWKAIANKFIDTYSQNIVHDLKNIFSDAEINQFIKDTKIKIEKDNSDSMLSKEPDKDLKKIMNDIKNKIDEIIQIKLKTNNFLEDSDIKKSEKEIILIEERLQQVLYKIGRQNKDYASNVIPEYYIKYSNLNKRGIKKYHELTKKGKNILIKYARSLSLSIIYLQTIFKDCSKFKSDCDAFSNDIILYFSDRQLLKDKLNNRNCESLNYTKRFSEINDFLIRFKINEDATKNITKTNYSNAGDSNSYNHNTTSVSYMEIPKNDEIKKLVKEYFLENHILKLNKEAFEESMLVWVQNFTNYWNEVKMWIEKYYLPPQIYFAWINNFIYLPIENIYYTFQTNFTNYSNEHITKVLEAINCLTENIGDVIYNQFINKKNEYLDQIKYLMNIELSLDCVSVQSTCNNANNFTFLYDHLLRNIYLTIKESKVNKKLVSNLNFKGLHRRDSISMNCFCSPCTSTSITPEPIVKHLEYLNLEFKGSINSTRTTHGCKSSRITNEYICKSVNNILLEKRKLFKLLQFQDKTNKKRRG